MENVETKENSVDEKAEDMEKQTEDSDAIYDIEWVEEQTLHDVTVCVGQKKKLIASKNIDGKLIHIFESSKPKYVLIDWYSSDESVASAEKENKSKNPYVQGISEGTAEYTIEYYCKQESGLVYYRSTIEVMVEKAEESVFAEQEYTLARGEAVTVEAFPKEKTNVYVDALGEEHIEIVKPQIAGWKSSSQEKALVEAKDVEGAEIPGSSAEIETLGGSRVTVTLTYKYPFSDGSLICEDAITIHIIRYVVEDDRIIMDQTLTEEEDAVSYINAATMYARDCADEDRIYTIVFPEGVYNIGAESIRVYSNTTLDLTEGATLKFTGVGGADGSHCIIKVGTNGSYDGEKDYNRSKKCAGYKGFQNISILGGTIQSTNVNTSTHLLMAHAANVTLFDVTFTGGAGMHMIEAAAIKNLLIEDCTFKNFTGSKAISASEETGRKAVAKRYGNYEALQIDVPASDDLYGGIYLDGTPMKNVTITGCLFDGVPRGLGSHSMLLGAYHSDVEISDNVFKNTAKEAMILLGYKNCTIQSNTLIDCGAGIVVQAFSPSSTYVLTKIFEGTKEYGKKEIHNVNIVIKDNDIRIKHRGIAAETVGIMVYGKNVSNSYQSKRPTTGKVWGCIAKKNYWIGNVKITNNTVCTEGYGIHLSDARSCTVKNNTIVSSKLSVDPKYGIYQSDGSKQNKLSKNKIKA